MQKVAVGENAADVTFDGVSKIYGTNSIAVDNISFNVKAGNLVTLLGPSGCGKTTTLRMIAGLEAVTKGKIFIGGEDVTEQPASERDVSMVFQSYALFPHKTVFENVCYGLVYSGFSKSNAEEKANSGLDLVGLKQLKDRYPSELSGGQQQRVAVARALVLEPQVLLFDEPLSNLDAKLRRSVRDEIRELQTRLSLTVVYVTHDQEEALAVSDEIIVMETGTIAQTGDPRSLYERPESLFVANFVGDTNILPCIVEQKNPSSKIIKISDFITQYENADLKVGTGSALIRPEHVNLNQTVSEKDLHGTITKATYVGSKMEYTVTTAVGNIFVIKNSNEDEFSEGQLVSIELPSDKLRVFNK